MSRFTSPVYYLTLLVTAFASCMQAPRAALSQSISWSHRLVSDRPSARADPAMAYDAARGITVLFGGVGRVGSDFIINAETWEWNGTAWTERVLSGPSARRLHAMAYDAARGVTVLFGGLTNNYLNAETWEWNGTTWTQRVVSGPSARYLHAMAYDAARGVTVLFGGGNADVNAETWEWNGTTWTQRVVSGPSARTGHALAYDAARGVTVLFGGYVVGNPNLNTETWEWNGTTWTQRVVSGPPGRSNHAMAYDAARGVTVLFGGDSSGSNADTWEWNGTVWTQSEINGPSARAEMAMAYDATRGATVLFGGGNNGTFFAETWELTVPCLAPTITTQPLDQTTSPDAPVTFFVEATSGPGCIIPEPLTYQWQRRNPAIIDPNEQGAWINLSDGNGFTNTRTSALLITRSTLGLATGYRCLITGGCRCTNGEPPITYTDTVNFSVACPADFNADGGINGEDIEAFFLRWEAGC